jgi:ATP-binding cassette subfamily F protein uup
MDRLTERLFIFEGEGKIREFSGNYTDYREYVAENDQNAARIQEKKTPAVAEKVEKTKEKKSLSFKEKQEYEDLEKQIAAAEAKKVQLAEQLNGETDFTKISLVSGQIQALTKEIDKNTDRWLELSLSV